MFVFMTRLPFALCVLPFITSILSASAQNGSILHDGIQRTYIVHAPPDFTSADTLPLVFSLHGLGMTAQWQSDLSQFNPIADRERFIVVYPQGLTNTTGLNAWNTFSAPYHSGVDDVGFISALIDTLFRDYHIDLSRVYSCGMSNGGFMSYRLACELDGKIAAIASVTGCMTDSMEFYCAPSRPFPVMHFHGTADPIVAYDGAGSIKSVPASLEYWIQYNHCPSVPDVDSIPDINTSDNTTAAKIYWGPCDGNAEVIHYKVFAGGHTWPGSPEDFFGVGGNINLDIMASEIIWEFFNRYSLPENTVSTPQRDEENAIISLYPNPVEDLLNIKVAVNESGKIHLSDIAGNKIMERKFNAHNAPESLSLNVNNLPAGMYLLTFESAREAGVFKILHR